MCIYIIYQNHRAHKHTVDHLNEDIAWNGSVNSTFIYCEGYVLDDIKSLLLDEIQSAHESHSVIFICEANA